MHDGLGGVARLFASGHWSEVFSLIRVVLGLGEVLAWYLCKEGVS